ncbi:MAG TPA: SDR family oxidoreductase [Bordetella sp.]
MLNPQSDIREVPAGNRLEGKVALVFGAGSSAPGWSNGKAAAVVYARQGAQVVCVDIGLPAAQETADLISGVGGQATAHAADVTIEADIARVVRAVREAHGRIDILHNNVGMTSMGDIESLPMERWQKAVEINLFSVVHACRQVLPVMRNQGGGAIVNISSLASIQINEYPYPAYQSTKAAVNHLTRSLAVNYAPHNIRVNAVLPGVMYTPLIDTQIAGNYANRDEMLAKRHAASPMGHMGDAWDVAYASLFLASDEARYITGVIMPVDGGKACAAR